MSNTQAYIESSSGELRPPVVSRTDEIFDVDVFVDLPNIGKSLASLDYLNVDYGVLVSIIMREFAKGLGITSDRPAGVVIISGDADYRPVLREITMQHPPVRATVAAFTDALSNIYLNDRNCSWEDPIILDPYIFELNSESRN